MVKKPYPSYLPAGRQMMHDNDPEAVQRDFLKYTAQMIKKDLQKITGKF